MGNAREILLDQSSIYKFIARGGLIRKHAGLGRSLRGSRSIVAINQVKRSGFGILGDWWCRLHSACRMSVRDLRGSASETWKVFT
jgi:hypothetical protein